MKSLSILLLSLIAFVAFSFHYEVPQFNFVLGGNDFNKADVGNWYLYEVMMNLFLILIGWVGIDHKDLFIKRFFTAIIIEGLVSITRYTIFGFYEPFYMAAIANAIPLSYIFYSYFVYVNRTK